VTPDRQQALVDRLQQLKDAAERVRVRASQDRTAASSSTDDLPPHEPEQAAAHQG
jgi:hypothetical protein